MRDTRQWIAPFARRVMNTGHRMPFLAVIICLTTAFVLPATAAKTKPNVLLVMVDDLGYNDLSCYGSPTMKTPILDDMAKDGMRFTDFYAGATVCTPSRMALLSGSYPTRIGWHGGVLGFGMKGYSGLPRAVHSMAEMFKEAGYRTAMAGKWHLGTKDLFPMNHGFDSTYYIPASNNMKRQLYRGSELLEENSDNTRLTEIFTREVIRVINEKSDKPFFVYVPFTAPHFPAEAHPDWKGKSSNGAYGDVVEEMDSRMGEILKTLKKNRIDDKTLIVFLSDNGPDRCQRKFAKATPYGGGKWTSREGGTRVPCIFRWPGVIKPGQVCKELTAAIDLYPTLAEACGIDIKIPEGGQKLDGVSVWGTITGKNDKHARSDLLYWQGWGLCDSIRVGDYKLFFGSGKGVPNVNDGPALFNLREDPAESKNISAEHPEKVKDMLTRARERLQDIHDNHVRMAAWDESEWRVKDWKPGRKWGKWIEKPAETQAQEK